MTQIFDFFDEIDRSKLMLIEIYKRGIAVWAKSGERTMPFKRKLTLNTKLSGATIKYL